MSSDSLTASAGLPRGRIALLMLMPAALIGLAWGVPLAARSFWRSADVNPPETEIDGALSYAQHCAHCHGEKGDGRGSTILQPPARYFGRDKYKFATTLNGVPSDADLMRLVERGIPGSAMPGFAHVPEAARRACIAHVRHLARQGIYDAQVQKALKNDDDPEPVKFALVAAQLSQPGATLEIPPVPPGSPEAVARGKTVYLRICAACHGPEGKGDGPQVKDLRNDDGTPNYPRDLTLGLYKAGGEPEQLYARIVLGIPGTPMPASDKLTREEVFDLIRFLQSLVKP